MKDIILVDNNDSFTLNIFDLIKSNTDYNVVLLNSTYTSLKDIKALNPSSIVISPGPNSPSDYPLLFEIINEFQGQIPMLGICLGHQAIGEFYEFKLVKSNKPMHGISVDIECSSHPIFDGINFSLKVMRYNSLTLIGKNNQELSIIAQNKNGEIMAISHNKFKIIGLQFHPESIGTEYGDILINNWFKYIKHNNNA